MSFIVVIIVCVLPTFTCILYMYFYHIGCVYVCVYDPVCEIYVICLYYCSDYCVCATYFYLYIVYIYYRIVCVYVYMCGALLCVYMLYCCAGSIVLCV